MAAGEQTITFSAVGQAVVRRSLGSAADEYFSGVADIISKADIGFTNLENTIRGRHGGWPMKTPLLHIGPPAVLDDLQALGFNALSLSNNHAFDLGPGGILSTLEEVDRRGFLHAGTGPTRSAAASAGFATLRGGHRVALIAADAGPQLEQAYARDEEGELPSRPGNNRLGIRRTLRVPQSDFQNIVRMRDALGDSTRRAALSTDTAPGEPISFYGVMMSAGERFEEHREPDADDLERYLGSIRDAAREADFVVAYLHHHHWEAVLSRTPDWMTRLARQAIDAGANVFVSHGVPQLQGIEIYKNRPIFYSLGNFIFHNMRQEYYSTRSVSWESIIANCEFDTHGALRSVELIPVLVGGKDEPLLGERHHEGPMLAPPEHGATILARLAKHSLEFGTVITEKNGRGAIDLPRTAANSPPASVVAAE